MSDIDKIIGRQVKMVYPHPWADHLAEVVGYDERIGLRLKLKRNDAMDGTEFYATKPSQYKVIPKGLETR